MSRKSRSGWFEGVVTGWKRTISFHPLDAAFRIHQTHCSSPSDSHMFPRSVCALGQNWGVSKQWKSSLSFYEPPELSNMSVLQFSECTAEMKYVWGELQICLVWEDGNRQPSACLFYMRVFEPAGIQVTVELDATPLRAPCAYQRAPLRKEIASATRFSIFPLQGRSFYRDTQQHFFSQPGSVCNAKTWAVANYRHGDATTSGKFCLSIWHRGYALETQSLYVELVCYFAVYLCIAPA